MNVPRPCWARTSPRRSASAIARVTVARLSCNIVASLRWVGRRSPRCNAPLATPSAMASTSAIYRGPEPSSLGFQRVTTGGAAWQLSGWRKRTAPTSRSPISRDRPRRGRRRRRRGHPRAAGHHLHRPRHAGMDGAVVGEGAERTEAAGDCGIGSRRGDVRPDGRSPRRKPPCGPRPRNPRCAQFEGNGLLGREELQAGGGLDVAGPAGVVGWR